MSKTKLSGEFIATNPETKKNTVIKFSKMGWLSENGYFNFVGKNARYVINDAKLALKRVYGNKIKGFIGS